MIKLVIGIYKYLI